MVKQKYELMEAQNCHQYQVPWHFREAIFSSIMINVGSKLFDTDGIPERILLKS